MNRGLDIEFLHQLLDRGQRFLRRRHHHDGSAQRLRIFEVPAQFGFIVLLHADIADAEDLDSRTLEILSHLRQLRRSRLQRGMKILDVDVANLQRFQAFDRIRARKFAHGVAGDPEFETVLSSFVTGAANEKCALRRTRPLRRPITPGGWCRSSCSVSYQRPEIRAELSWKKSPSPKRRTARKASHKRMRVTVTHDKGSAGSKEAGRRFGYRSFQGRCRRSHPDRRSAKALGRRHDAFLVHRQDGILHCAAERLGAGHRERRHYRMRTAGHPQASSCRKTKSRRRLSLAFGDCLT